LETKIHGLAGQPFNVASPLQLKNILFDVLQIDTKGIGKTKTGLSTAAAQLEKLQDKHPIIPLIMEYRELAKLKSTYLDTLPNLINKTTGRIHTSFNQTVAATGRLSSSDPNLQNIPIRTELGNKVRQAFVAEPGHVLLSADYSQIELRIVASLADDKSMIEIFRQGEDIHRATAAKIHGLNESEVTKTIRNTAKEVNFGVLYGMGSRGLAQRTGISQDEARAFIDKYFETFSGVANYIEETKVLAAKLGYAETLFGRRRYLPELKSGMPQVRAAAERMAVNMPIQGTAADLMKLAMIEVHKELPKLKTSSRMILQVHDELVLEVPQEEINRVAVFVKEAMEGVTKLKVPIEVHVSAGPNWGQMETIKI
jgi:DNA polymerase I